MKHRLLIVDDEVPILKSMQKYFSLQGLRTDIVQNRKGAEQLIDEGRYSVVIIDLRLDTDNDADGLELAKYVKRVSPTTRVVILTAYGTPQIEQEAKQFNVDCFLYKPVPLSKIYRIITGLIQEHSDINRFSHERA